MVKRALCGAAALLAVAALIGCELITGIHEREATEGPVSDGGVDAAPEPCPEGMGDCDGLLENGCETPLAADPKNCGACGHDCLEDGCAESACVPRVMATGESTPQALAVSEAGLFWSNSKGVVRKLPLEGGNVQTIGDAPPSGTTAVAVALSDQSVFWTLFESMPAEVRPGVVMRATLDGVDPQPVFLDQKFPAGLAVDATTVYWAAAYEDTIFRGPSNGGAPQVLAKLPSASLPFDVAVDKDNVYWTAYLDGTLGRVPKGGGKKVELANKQRNPLSLAVNDKAVYWVNLNEGDYKEGSVVMQLKDAAEDTPPIVVAEQQYAPNAIAADETAVYWTTLGHDVGDKAPGTGSVMKMPLDADGKPVANMAPIVLAKEQNSPTTVKVYKNILYWTTGASGNQVLRMIQ